MTSENPPSQPKPSDHADTIPTDQSQPTPQLPPAMRIPEPEPPPAPHCYQITCKTEKDWRDKTKFWAEILGFCVLIVYTIFTGLMYCANKKAAYAAKSSADTAHESLVRSNRPWVGESDQPIVLTPPTMGRNTISDGTVYFDFKNFGPSPALHVAFSAAPYVPNGPIDPKQPFLQEDLELNSECTLADMETNGGPATMTSGGKTAPFQMAAGGVAIFPNGPYPINWPLTAGGTPIPDGYVLKILECVSYRDQFNERVHHTTFCYMSLGLASAIKRMDKLYLCPQKQDAD